MPDRPPPHYARRHLPIGPLVVGACVLLFFVFMIYVAVTEIKSDSEFRRERKIARVCPGGIIVYSWRGGYWSANGSQFEGDPAKVCP